MEDKKIKIGYIKEREEFVVDFPDGTQGIYEYQWQANKAINTFNIEKRIKDLLKECNICKKKFTGFGNNSEPIKKGLCCDKCNFTKVLPVRLNQFQEAQK